MCTNLFKGPQGIQGKTGIQGTSGAQGLMGPIGIQGTQGLAGEGVDENYVNELFKEQDKKIKALDSSLNNTINAHSIFYSIANAPLTSTSKGTINSIAYDSNFLYICIETDKWLRTSLNTW